MDMSTQKAYYYNTISKKTVWEKPDSDVIVPVHFAQQSLSRLSLIDRFGSYPSVIHEAKMIPKILREEIQQFSIEGFAAKFFKTKKVGVFKRKVAVEVCWSKDLLSRPLLVLNKEFYKTAIKCNKSKFL